jgi:hypothetical protein
MVSAEKPPVHSLAGAVSDSLSGDAVSTPTQAVTSTPTVPSGPPRIVFTIGEAARRPEPHYEPPAPAPVAAPEPSPAVEEKSAGEGGLLPSETAPAVTPAEQPPAVSGEKPGTASGPAAPPTSPTGTERPSPSVPPTPPRRDTRPFGFGVFDTPSTSDS